jgi:GNAT superfamily N-acetyltransferase
MESGMVKGVEVVVRPLGAGDVQAIVELIAQLGYERTGEEVRRWIASVEGCPETQMAIVACVGDEVAGWIEVSIQSRLQSGPFALIGGLVVRDGRRGQGIGGRLCEQAERWARERGVNKIRVTSRSSREDAHRFYAREGYRQTKTSVVFEKSVGADATDGERSAERKSATIDIPAKSSVADL